MSDKIIMRIKEEKLELLKKLIGSKLECFIYDKELFKTDEPSSFGSFCIVSDIVCLNITNDIYAIKDLDGDLDDKSCFDVFEIKDSSSYLPYATNLEQKKLFVNEKIVSVSVETEKAIFPDDDLYEQDISIIIKTENNIFTFYRENSGNEFIAIGINKTTEDMCPFDKHIADWKENYRISEIDLSYFPKVERIVTEL